jgi:ferrochelatase
MASTSRYVDQLKESCAMVGEGPLVFQSRSGAPNQLWLEPDINTWLRENRPPKVAIVPIGFISDHMEVLYDLDTEALETCQTLGLEMVRVATAGTHPKFVAMIAELVDERLKNEDPNFDRCAVSCCPRPATGRPAS